MCRRDPGLEVVPEADQRAGGLERCETAGPPFPWLLLAQLSLQARADRCSMEARPTQLAHPGAEERHDLGSGDLTPRVDALRERVSASERPGHQLGPDGRGRRGGRERPVEAAQLERVEVASGLAKPSQVDGAATEERSLREGICVPAHPLDREHGPAPRVGPARQPAQPRVEVCVVVDRAGQPIAEGDQGASQRTGR